MCVTKDDAVMRLELDVACSKDEHARWVEFANGLRCTGCYREVEGRCFVSVVQANGDERNMKQQVLQFNSGP